MNTEMQGMRFCLLSVVTIKIARSGGIWLQGIYPLVMNNDIVQNLHYGNQAVVVCT